MVENCVAGISTSTILRCNKRMDQVFNADIETVQRMDLLSPCCDESSALVLTFPQIRVHSVIR
jgi:hypothetical protein